MRPPVTFDVGEAPGGIAIDRRTDTIYVTGQVSNDVSVIDGARCNARVTRGCRRRPARVRAGVGARGIAVNEATNTVYVANTGANTISVIDGATCNGDRAPRLRSSGRGGAGRHRARGASRVDEVTNTVYVTNAGSNTVTVLNGRTCNGAVHSGCAGSAPKTPVA